MEWLQAIRDYGLHSVALVVAALVIKLMYNRREKDRAEHKSELSALQAQHKSELQALQESKDQGARELWEQIAAEQRSRLEDANRYTQSSLSLQAEVVSAAQKMQGVMTEHARLTDLVRQLVADTRARRG